MISILSITALNTFDRQRRPPAANPGEKGENMKPKDRPLAWWKGRKFTYWARQDTKDTRKIHYTIHHRSLGQGLLVFTFTSDDLVDGYIQYLLHTGLIKEIRIVNNEWFVTIAAGIILEEDIA